MEKRAKVPRFKSEAKEAEWWEKNRTVLDRELVAALRDGKLKRAGESMAKAGRATKVISLRLAEEDLRLARAQAASRGLPYQTYLKSLLHEALRKTG